MVLSIASMLLVGTHVSGWVFGISMFLGNCVAVYYLNRQDRNRQH